MPSSPCSAVLDPDDDKTRQLRFAVVLTGVVFAGELAGGLWTRSLALLSDAGHVFADVVSLALSLFALRLACRAPTARHSYGLHRAEVLAALVNGLSLLVICGLIFREAYQRLARPPEVRAAEMLGIAVLGTLANWIVAARLAHHDSHDINLRSAYLHVLGDLLASLAVVVAAVIITVTGRHVVDPILSMGIGTVILVGGVRVIGEALHILLEGVPRGIDLGEVAAAMVELPGVEAVHHLHAWSICPDVRAFSAHVVACPESEQGRARLRQELEALLSQRFGFCLTTLEMECEPCTGAGLLRPVVHGNGARNGHQD